MFDLKKNDITGQANRLLYNIWQELKRLNKPQPARPMRKAAKGKAVKAKFYRKCKKCGTEFDNYGFFMKHMKEHKEEGV
jgi:hypothetical protein